MNFSIDWGTLVISVPVIAASCFAAIRFIGKSYVKEHFDKRLETHKNELQKENESFKLMLEKEKNTYIKALEMEADKNKQKFALYSAQSYQSSQRVWIQVQECFSAYRTYSTTLNEYSDKFNSLIKILDTEKVFLSKELIELTEEFIAILTNAWGPKDYVRSAMNGEGPSKKLDDVMKVNSANSEKLKYTHDKIGDLIRSELRGYK